MALIGTELVPSKRLESLDVLRGITIAGMLLVNNPGSWGAIYPPLEHAAWNGWTPTDLVFPFFLFMVGVAMMYSFPKRLASGASRRTLFGHVVRRAAALMVLGWWGSTWSQIFWPATPSAFSDGGSGGALAAAILLRAGFVIATTAGVALLAGVRRSRGWLMVFALALAVFAGASLGLGFDDPLHRAIAGIRIPGVLVRIAWCYLIASGIYFLTPSPRALVRWTIGLLTAYAFWMTLVPIPGFGLPDLARGFPTADTPLDQLFSNWCFYIDYHLLGTHTWSVRQLSGPDGLLIWSFDPEGLLSTVSAVCSVLIGMLAGLWMRRTDVGDAARLNGLFLWACWLMGLGIVLSIWMPINKRIWTSSYTLFTGGMALLCLAVLYHSIDLRGIRRWARPFLSYGRNAIFAFVASGMMATALGKIRVDSFAGGGLSSAKAWAYDALLATFGNPKLASLVFALAFVALWAGVAGWMDRRKIYFKV